MSYLGLAEITSFDPCVTPEMEKFSLDLLQVVKK